MKVLVVTPSVGDIYGGPSKSVIELTESLGQSNITIDLATTNANGDKLLDVPLQQWIEKGGYRIQYFPHITGYCFSWSLTSWLFNNISAYDLVHTHGLFTYPVLSAYWVCQINKIPYVVTPRGMLEPWALAYKTRKKKPYFYLLEQPALQKASTIHLLASSEAENVKKLNLKPPFVLIPNGIRKQDFESASSPEIFYQYYPHLRHKKLIIFLGRIDPKKGLDLLAPAFAKAHRLFTDTHLVIAGPDNIGFMPIAQQYFQKAGCDDAVTFTGILTGEMKYSALVASSIYVAPSYSEGFSMSVLEGMASGLPCVITTGCNFPESSNVAKIVDIDCQAISDALIDLLANPEEARNMGQKAQKFILENYTWDKIAVQMIEIYSKIIINPKFK